jgi:Mn-dependent DtxR family transcriptional regulator
MSKFSIEAYIEIQPSIKPTEEMILSLLSKRGATLREVAERLSMPLQTASARLSELHDSGLIHQSEHHKATYHLTPFENIASVKYKRDRRRYEKWNKLGIEKGYFGKEMRDLMDNYFDGDGNEKNPSPDLPVNELLF